MTASVAVQPAVTREALAVPATFKSKVFWLSRKTAETGNYLEELRQRKGVLTTDTVVQAAAKVGSVLHEFFTWDNAKAAEMHRHRQARQLLKRLLVRDAGKEPLRAFSAVEIKGDHAGDEAPHPHLMYLPTTAALQSAIYRHEIIERLKHHQAGYLQQLSLMRRYAR